MTLDVKLNGDDKLQLYEVEFSPQKVAEKYGFAQADIVDFSLNVNPYGPPTSSVLAARSMLEQGGRYPDVSLNALRSRIAEWLDVDGTFLFFGAGLDDVLKLIVQGLAKPGDKALIHIPTFPRYQLECQLAGVEVSAVQNDPPWSISAKSIRAALGRTRFTLAFICTPNNPTGAQVGLDEIRGLANDFASTVFIVDEAMIDPADSSAKSLCNTHHNIVVLRTFSKFFGLAGYRVGFAVAQPEIIAALEAVRPPFNVSLISAAAAAAALSDSRFLDATRKKIRQERKQVSDAFAGFTHVRIASGYANMLLVETLNQRSDAFCEALARTGLLVADGRSFVGLENKDTVRISLQGKSANARLIKEIGDLR